MKTMLSAGAIALTMATGTLQSSADEWHGRTSHRAYSHHHAQYHARPYDAQPQYYANRSYAPRYDDGYARRAAYNAGFNRGAYAQWSIAYRRWQYDYALWQQRRGPTGIFAVAGALTGGGGQYASSPYASSCDCDR